MISHKYKCIFIHISKCAGTTIEKALGINIDNQGEDNNKNLFGWHKEHKIFLQHATPQQLFDLNLIDDRVWNDYFKFIVVRNPWGRAVSDYIWVSKNLNIKDTFVNFINKKGAFENVMTERNINYRGDHLNKQIDYFYLNEKQINFDKVIRFENLSYELPQVANILKLPNKVFQNKLNVGRSRFNHYSEFYNKKRRDLIDKKFSSDIQFFDYSFEDKKSIYDYIKVNISSSYFLSS